MKYINKTLSVVLALSILFGGFSQIVFAYDLSNYGQIKSGKSLVDGNIDLNKLSTSSQKTNNLLAELSTTTKEKNDLLYSKQIKNNKREYVEGEILVKYKNNKINLNTTSGKVLAMSFSNSKSLEGKEDLVKNNISVLKIKDRKTVEEKIVEIQNDPNVEYAQPNFQYYPQTISSNDTYKANLWGLDNTGQTVNTITGTNDADIDAPEAWAVNEGTNAQVIVAVIDSGVAYNHPDLLDNMWNGVSCVSDTNAPLGNCNYGYDFEDLDKTPLPTTSYHGTHIAGIIAALKNNNKGVIGVAPNAKIMALKSSLTTAENIKAINFAKYNGAKVINASWTGSGSDQLLKDAIESFSGIFVVAAGNESVNNEITHSYPSDYSSSNIISVAATDQNDNLASFSNYGVNSVDVGAPGGEHPDLNNGVIYSTIPLETSVLSQDFESITPPSVPSGWVKGGTSNNWGTYQLDSGTYWGKVLYGDLAYPYTNSRNTTITSPIYNLSAGGANINFYTKCDTEYTSYSTGQIIYDYMTLEYSSDGTNFNEIIRWDEPYLDWLMGDSSSVGGAIYNFSGNIPSQYLTSNFKLRFRWVTNASDNNYDGCLVDDIQITKFSDGSDEKYGYIDGTSMAAPHVSGLAALILGYKPELTYLQVKDIILATGDSLGSLSGKTVTGKRINAYNALLSLTEVITPVASLETGSYSSEQTVSLSSATASTTIYYTTNGSNPTASSTVYSTPLSIISTTVLKAMAVKTGMINSDVAIYQYYFGPLTPMYRLYNTSNGAYLYVRGAGDKAHVIGTWPVFEFTDGVAAFFAPLTAQEGLTPIYRLYNTLNGMYLYTRGDADMAHVIGTWPEFEFTDGVPAFYASLTAQEGLTPIYRLYNTSNGAYLYTRGDADRDHVINTWPVFEFTDGIPAFYAQL
jgi:subtilisin family serine protease